MTDTSDSVELTIIVPTFNERDNVEPLLQKLEVGLRDIKWEVVFVDDDSLDGTAVKVREIGYRDRRIRCVQRIGRRGLSTAVIEGMLTSSAPYLAVLDGDLQHEESLLPQMLEKLKRDDLDVVVGSRYAAGGGVGQWNKRRAAMSTFATTLARVVVTADLTDPMSGFFVITRKAFEASVRTLSGQGFKILLDLFASAPAPYKFAEVPYTFRDRLHGESKLDSVALWEYLMLLADKLVGRFLPVRFVLFSFVGLFGTVIHLVVLRVALISMTFLTAQATATVFAMTINFTLNNLLTYRDRRLRGANFAKGLVTFYAICSVGALANVRLAVMVFEKNYAWWAAGLAGAAAGVVWNYAVTSTFTWGEGRKTVAPYPRRG